MKLSSNTGNVITALATLMPMEEASGFKYSSGVLNPPRGRYHPYKNTGMEKSGSTQLSRLERIGMSIACVSAYQRTAAGAKMSRQRACLIVKAPAIGFVSIWKMSRRRGIFTSITDYRRSCFVGREKGDEKDDAIAHGGRCRLRDHRRVAR